MKPQKGMPTWWINHNFVTLIDLDRWSLVVLAFVCCVGGSNGQANGQSLRQVQRFEREPEDQTAVVGETVVMACRVLNKGGVLQWTKDDFGLGSDRNLSGFERYSMIGTEDEGELRRCFNFYNSWHLFLRFDAELLMFSSFSLSRRRTNLVLERNGLSSSISRYMPFVDCRYYPKSFSFTFSFSLSRLPPFSLSLFIFSQVFAPY